jgi:hypothetical protein
VIRHLLRNLIAACLLVSLLGCADRAIETRKPITNINVSTPDETPVIWSTAEFTDQLAPELKREWTKFERSQSYRLAQPGDRNLTADATKRVRTNSPNQIIPFLIWWGAEGYTGPRFLIAIVVDPSRSDSNRYGLIVIAAPESEGRKYKLYWVAREEDMESYLISPASGSVFIECFRRDGTQQTKQLAWYRSRKQFELKERSPGR